MTIVHCPTADGKLAIPDQEECHHLVHVLRKRVGDDVLVTDGRGGGWRGRIESSDRSGVRIVLFEQASGPAHWGFRLHLAFAPPKHSGRLEWLMEKVTEVGVDRITILETKRTERSRWRHDRLSKLIVAAMKQSGQFCMPAFDEEEMSLSQFLQATSDQPGNRLIATCDWGNLQSIPDVYESGHDAILLIGPEGDFTPDEVALARSASFTPVLLGPNRLRTETAAIVACSQIHVLHEKG